MLNRPIARPDRSPRGAAAGQSHRGRDRGATLVEMILAISLVGIIMAAVSTAVVVLIRNSSETTERVGDAQDVRQLVNYFPGDIRSSTLERIEVTHGGAPRASECQGVPESAAVQHVAATSFTGLTRVEYRTSFDGTAAELHRWTCLRNEPEGPFGAATRTRIASNLDPADPVRTEWIGGRLQMTLVQGSGHLSSLAATPFSPDEPLAVAAPDPDDNPIATHCPANPNELNEGFMVMTRGDVTFNNGANESYGPVAVGGDLTFKNYRSSTQSGGTFFAEPDSVPTALLVEGMVNWPDSGGGYLRIHNGYLHVGNIANWTPATGGPNNELRLTAASGPQNRQIRVENTDQTFESVEMQGLFDFPAAFASFDGITNALPGLPGSCEGIVELELFGQNGVGEWNGGNVWLYFTPGKATVLTMTMAEYASIGNVNVVNGSAQPGRTTPLIINIVDEGVVSMPAGETNISRNHIPYVLWNFPNATRVNTAGAFWGGILAPNAVVHQNGDIRGNVISAGLVSNAGIISLQAFQGEFPWLSPAG